MAHPNPIPDRLKTARTKAGITQRELGIRIGMEPSSASGRMNHYEKGRHIPDIDTLKRMADELGVPINYFFCESEQTAELARLIANMTETEQAALIAELNNKQP
ncbi:MULTISPECIES: helix-turn-helix domain-containing protein [unclassified Leclercia]|uniref:helix-turn-helix domain-containing protein n=1 Tax=unclassified Leclercia TaxID=2627398 RepID=UPI002898B9A3|nr:helix-turn-helix transcriptional regulator [Leclercia sp.]